MKNIILLTLILVIVSCNKEVQKEKVEITPVTKNEAIVQESETVDQEEKEVDKDISKTTHKDGNPMIAFKKRIFDEDSDHKNLLGYYAGRFVAEQMEEVYNNNGSYSNKINISINHIKNDSIYGHSVVAGNSRQFKGKFDEESLFVKVSEPGDDKCDGVFEFTFYPKSQRIEGKWTANDNKISVTKRTYDLEKTDFEYDPTQNLNSNYQQSLSNKQFELMDAGFELEAIDSGKLKQLNSSTQELTNQDIENLNRGELEVLRNLIYARHGYSFKNRKMRYFFDMKVDWYIPVSTDIRSEITELEKKNIDLIKRYEQHAERYYDYFGR